MPPVTKLERAVRAIVDLTPEDRFYLPEDFVTKYKFKEPPFASIIGNIVLTSRYARFLPDGSRELFWQIAKRIVEGTYTIQKWHCLRNNIPWDEEKAQASAQEMFELIFALKFLPPGRGLWAMGTEYVYERGGAALNNCAFISTKDIAKDPSEPFCVLMDLSMCGVGVGGDTRGAGKLKICKPTVGNDILVVEDSREGWIALVRRYINAYAGIGFLPRSVDYSKVRKAGALIKGFGGVSSGPQPLIDLLANICCVLDKLIGQFITSEAIVDLFDYIGVAVVAGNVRRTAIIMFGDKEDKKFASLKDPELYSNEMRTHRWASNNSTFNDVGDDYTFSVERTIKSGEPGYYWLSNARAYGRMKDPPNWIDAEAEGANPCLEQTLFSYELCCLVETFPSLHDNYEDYQRTLKFAYLYAKTVTLVPTHNPKINKVLLKNRRIGCSMSGVVQAFNKFGRQAFLGWCDKGYRYIDNLDKIYSDWMCIPRSIKKTSIKPSGTVSLIPGVWPGIHHDHAEYYFRTIRFAKNDALVERLREAKYHIEDSVYDTSSVVVYFPVKSAYFIKGEKDVSIWEQLENAAQMQAYWADNQVSVTIKFKPEEAKDIKTALECYQTRLKGVSFLPHAHGYAQAPYQEITKEKYESEISRILPVDLDGVGGSKAETDRFCDSDVCSIKRN